MSESGIKFRIGVTGHRDILPEDIETARQSSREIVAKRMSPEQIAEAQRLAREWKPKK